jgi:hypothetical protein
MSNQPYAPPGTTPPHGAAGRVSELLARVPPYRKSSVMSALLLLGLALAFLGPMLLVSLGVTSPYVGWALGLPILITCIVVLSGPVYYARIDDSGQLEQWSIANKIVAALILAGWVYSIVRSFL